MEKHEYIKNNKVVFTETENGKIYVKVKTETHDNIIFYRGNSEKKAENVFNDIKKCLENNIF